MDSLLKNFISTKDAQDLSGYTSDYLARLARSGQITGRRVGHAWFIEKSSLERFLGLQKNRKIDRARSLARARAEELERHKQQVSARAAEPVLTKRISIPELSPRVRAFVSQAGAVAIAVAVVGSGALIARAGSFQTASAIAVSVARETATGFVETFGDVPSRIRADIGSVVDDVRASGTRVAARNVRASERFAPLALGRTDLSGLRMAVSVGAAPIARPEAEIAEATSTVVSHASVLTIVSDAYDLVTHPERLTLAVGRAYVASGEFVYDGIGAALAAYQSGVRALGVRALATAGQARDRFALAPRFISRMNFALGSAVIGGSQAAINGEVAGVYAAATAAPAAAAGVVALERGFGAALARAAAHTPSLAAAVYLRATAIPAATAPALAHAIFDAEYAGAARFVALTDAVRERYLQTVMTTGVFAYAGATGALAASRATGTALVAVPVAIRDASLGALGKAAFALRDLGAGEVWSLASGPQAVALAAASSSLSAGTQAAFAVYAAVSDSFSSAGRALASLVAPAPTVVLPTETPSPQVARGTASTTPASPPVVRRVAVTSYPTYTTVVQGVSQGSLDQSLASLRSDILATVAGMVKPVAAQTATNVTTIQQVNMIQKLDDLILTHPQLSDASISGSSSFSGTSASATTGSFDTLTARTASLATTTVSGGPLTVSSDATFGGTLTAGYLSVSGVSSGGAIRSPYFTATSTTDNTFPHLASTYATVTNATSTNLFAALGRFTAGIADSFTATLATITGLNVTNSTSTNATSTNLYATNASVGTLAGGVVSSLTANYLPKWNNGTFVNSIIQDDGTTARFPYASTTALSALNALAVGRTATSSIVGNYGASAIRGALTVYGNTTTGSASTLTIRRGSTNGNNLLSFNDQTGTSLLRIYTDANTGYGRIVSDQSYLTLGTAVGGTALSIDTTHHVNATASIVPTANQTYDLGSPAEYWNNGYLNNLIVNNLSAASTSISGTNQQSFSIDAHNPTSDAQDISLVFYRGVAPSNAVIAWDSTNKRFTFNQPMQVAGTITPDVSGSYNLGSSTSLWNNVYANNFVGTITPSGFSAGPVVFGGVGGALTQDSSLSWDNTNKRLGIGTAAPAALLSVGASSQFQVDASGNVTGGTYNGNTVTTGTGTLNLGSSALTLTGNSAINQDLTTTSAPTFGGLAVDTNTLYVDRVNHRVGIKTSSPIYDLDVGSSGSIRGGYLEGVYAIKPVYGGTLNLGLNSGTATLKNYISAWTTNTNILFNLATYNFTFDSGKVGVGTTTPWALLSVNAPAGSPSFAIGSSTKTSFLVDKNGNVGIGTAAPGNNLHVQGTDAIGTGIGISVTNTSSSAYSFAMYKMLAGTDGAGGIFFGSRAALINWGIANGITFRAGLSTQDIGFSVGNNAIGTGNGPNLILKSNGNVGIGTAAPAALLSVGASSQFQVDASGNVTGGTYNGNTVTSPSVIGGVGVGSTLTLKGTSGNGTATVSAINMAVGNNGNLNVLKMYNNGLTEMPNNWWRIYSGTDSASLPYPTTGEGFEGGYTTNQGAFFLSVSRSPSTTYKNLSFKGSNLYLQSMNGNIEFRVGASGSTVAGVFNAAGNVGIGTASPSSRLDVVSALTASSGTDYGMKILPTYNQTATAAGTDLLINRTETAIGSGAQYLIDAQVGGVSKFNVTNTGQGYFAGNVGIGTASPGEKLEVNIAAASAGGLIIGSTSNGSLGAFLDATLGPLFESHTDASGKSTANYAAVRQIFSGLGYKIQTSPATAIGGTRTFTDRLIVTQSGDVGIGTASPGAGLHIASNGAASTPGELLSGTWYTGGTITTTKPQLLIEPSGVTSAGWNTNGTGLGINAASGFSGSLIRAEINGATKFEVAPTYISVYSGGGTVFASTISAASTLYAGTQSSSAANSALVAMAGGTQSATSGSNQAVKIYPTYNQTSGTAANTDLLINRTETAIGSGAQYLIDAQVGGVSKFNVTNTGQGYFAGNVGIGTTSPATLFEVGGATANVTFDGYKNCTGFTSNANGLLACTASDERLKQSITPLDASTTLAALEALTPVSFNWRPETERGSATQFGLIAQQVETVFPNLVTVSNPTALTPDGTLSVNYPGLIAPMILGIQQLAGRIGSIDLRLASLEDRVAKLESGAVSSGSSSTFSTSSLASALASFGITVQNGLASFVNLVAGGLTVGSGAHPTGITMYDKVTGEPYCFEIANGSPVTEPGACPPAGSSASAPVTSGTTGASCTLAASPATVAPGDRVTLAWDAPGADTFSIDQGVGSVSPAISGTTTSKAVNTATTFTGTVTTPQGAIGTCTATVSVSASTTPPPPASSGTTSTTTTTTTTATSTPSDTTPPVVTLNGSAAMQLTVGDTFVDAGATATDAVDGDLTAAIVETGAVDTSAAGTYTLTYAATDAAGNTGSASRVVVVAAPPPPPPAAPATTMATSTAP